MDCGISDSFSFVKIVLTTPNTIGPSVEALRKELHLQEEPIWIPVQSRSDSKPADCFCDVKHQIAEFGGSAIYGWQIWEWPRIMIEAEFHAVWNSPDEEILDVSVKPDGENRILFLPDPNRTYEGRQIDNVRVALWKNNLVHAFIGTSKQIFEVREKGRISETEFRVNADEIELLIQRKLDIERRILGFPRAWPH
jgi:hypothetical protein